MDHGIWEADRAGARKYFDMQQAAMVRSSNASAKGDKTQATRHSQLAKHYGCLREQFDEAAAESAFSYYNDKHHDTTIDLHCLYVREATEKLTQRINALITVRQYKLDVIVGKGLHSQNGAVLKPSVAQFAKDNDIQFEIDERNEGVIHLTKLRQVCVPKYQGHKRSGTPLAVNLEDLIVKKVRKNRKNSNFNSPVVCAAISAIIGSENRQSLSSTPTAIREENTPSAPNSRRRRLRKKKKADTSTLKSPAVDTNNNTGPSQMEEKLEFNSTQSQNESVADSSNSKDLAITVPELNERECCNLHPSGGPALIFVALLFVALLALILVIMY